MGFGQGKGPENAELYAKVKEPGVEIDTQYDLNDLKRKREKVEKEVDTRDVFTRLQQGYKKRNRNGSQDSMQSQESIVEEEPKEDAPPLLAEIKPPTNFVKLNMKNIAVIQKEV